MSGTDKADYKKTLNLPQTSFPMKANLVQREPEILKGWEEGEAYRHMVESGGEKGFFILHDGPPYANGHIHLGTALNKILKDIIIKSRNMQGWRTEFVPGWDCHGLPIEIKVEQELGDKKQILPVSVVRKACRAYADKWMNIQRKEFKRLGVLGVWDKPYISMDPDYEAVTARELCNFMSDGSVSRSKKPVHWCSSCHTALAEAEVEYYDHSSPSIYVRFPINDPNLKKRFPEAVPGHSYIVIWTTTPWTVPDNMAIALHPDLNYVMVRVEGECYILAEERLDECRRLFGWLNAESLGIARGMDLKGLLAEHPFYDRRSPLVTGGHVTLESGTGVVHTAPGHGREDYEIGLENNLEILSPLDDDGRFMPGVEFFAGLTVEEANTAVIAKLNAAGHLIREDRINHSYPHCWRCKKPVIFRATTQWFISMDANYLRERALKAIRKDVRWIPAWGEERIYSMIEHRPDWCVSRQRTWGVPIVALICKSCGRAWHESDWALGMTDRFAVHPTGCDYWFDAPLEEIVPDGLRCPDCGGADWRKETDILDVWFDSGTSFAAVLERRPECRFPADMYLEGSDQHRGWFHSSLLAAIGTRRVPPYREVLTHGYVVDGEGKKMSKSMGNAMVPDEVINKFGAEILRLWVSSVDYREDVRMSGEILNRLVDAYRRIRNTCRYLLGSLYDFSKENIVSDADMDALDRHAVDLVSRAHQDIQAAYVGYEFHKVFHNLHNLCVSDLSAFYLDVIKDRLYASAPASLERRSAQTAMYRILLILLADMAPVMSFTAEEILTHLSPALLPDVKTVFALRDEHLALLFLEAEEVGRRQTLLDVRAEITRAIEPLRKAGQIGHALDTDITLYAGAALRRDLLALGTDLRPLFIVSGFSLHPLEEAPSEALRAENVEDLRIVARPASGEKCGRCWVYSRELGSDPNHPDLCPRCAAVLTSIAAS
ncbi:MAG: isoleucine--tRNA ligase [Desulfovibrio sp.]|nr:isoleucine--tRNA ligase [Desulfovibrio sp.]